MLCILPLANYYLFIKVSFSSYEVETVSIIYDRLTARVSINGVSCENIVNVKYKIQNSKFIYLRQNKLYSSYTHVCNFSIG